MTGDRPELNDCGCCEGTTSETPREVTNQPGQDAIAYRVGTHAQFKESLLAGLTRTDRPQLGALTTRSDSDFTIALLDAWAMTGDVLTFYQERIANESYRRTATERRSLLELARLIGYRPSSGVAASTDLAFTLDDFPNQPPVETPLVSGLKVQTIPEPGEEAQIFESVETIEARSTWNAIRPRLTQSQTLSGNMTSLRARGGSLNIGKGETVALLVNSSLTPKTVLAVTPEDQSDTTLLEFALPSSLPAFTRPAGAPSSIEQTFPALVPLDGGVVTKIMQANWRATDLMALASIQGWPLSELTKALREAVERATPPYGGTAYIFRQRAAIFGHNAPAYASLPANLRLKTQIEAFKASSNAFEKVPVDAAYPTNWDNRTLESDAEASGGQRSIYLDNVYAAIVPGSRVLLRAPGTADLLLEVTANTEVTRTAFTISAKVSRLRVKLASAFPTAFTMQSTTLLGQSEVLVPAPIPIPDKVSGEAVTLDGPYLGLVPGRKVVVTGERVDLPGVIEREIRTLREVLLERGHTVLEFDRDLDHVYQRTMIVDGQPATLTVNANVAAATHGETREEILGSGDGSQAFQRFALRQPPLTYISSTSPTGSESTLRVYVNNILWKEVPALFGHGSEERVYSTLTDEQGVTTVQFGDGRMGSRLPTGQDNVRAVYRRGTGTGGLVKAGQISMPMTRPLGLKGATNPLAPTGAQDPESVDDARENLPLRVVTLGRIVSLRDYEDFARAFSGIAKALAVETWNGEQQGVLITVAGPNGAAIDPASKLFDNLQKALRDAGDPVVPIVLVSYRKALFRLDATLVYHPDHLETVVKPAVEAALRAAFSFRKRAFGQPVALSEVIAVIQQVEGVVAVDVNELYRTDQAPARHPMPRLTADVPRSGSGPGAGAELLTLDPAPIDLR